MSMITPIIMKEKLLNGKTSIIPKKKCPSLALSQFPSRNVSA
jgi:hypothetical protein